MFTEDVATTPEVPGTVNAVIVLRAENPPCTVSKSRTESSNLSNATVQPPVPVVAEVAAHVVFTVTPLPP